MENINKDEMKEKVIEGVRVGLFAYILSYAICFLLALIIGLVYMENVSEIILGDIGTIDDLNFSTVLRMSILIMNLSVFNQVGDFRVGLLIFVVVPAVIFAIASRRRNKSIIVSLVASVIFGLLLLLTSFVTKGTLLGISINFVSFRNLLGSIFVALGVQLLIHIWYGKDVSVGIKKSRWMILGLTSASFVVGIISYLSFMSSFAISWLLKLAGAIVLLPNLICYSMFSFFGIQLKFSESVWKIFQSFDLNITYFINTPIWLKGLLIIIFITGVIVCIMTMKKEMPIVDTLIFAFSLSLFSLFCAYCTKIGLGTIVVIKDIDFGVDLGLAFFVPFVMINLVGFVIILIKKLIKVVKEN